MMIVQKVALIYNGARYVALYDYPDFTPGRRFDARVALVNRPQPKRAQKVDDEHQPH
jgi:hypothetical protein